MEQRVLYRSFGRGKVNGKLEPDSKSPECQAKMLKLCPTDRSFIGYKEQ